MDSEKNNERLQSLDFFRGITIAGMILVNDPGSWEHVYAPLEHAKWHGWTPTDLIFPFFLFIVGVSITLSLTRKKNSSGSNKILYGRIIRRTAILFCIGLFLNGFPYFDLGILRIPGVLQRIAVCYMIASFIFLGSGRRTQIIFTVFFLVFYGVIMEWGAVYLGSPDAYQPGLNFAAYIDNLFLKGHMWAQTGSWDPEGLISTLPAISTTLFGVLTGYLFLSKNDPFKKTSLLLISGNLLIVCGMIWEHWMPINKNLWTSSYALFTAGMAMVFLGISYYLIDIRKWRSGLKPFVIYGKNPITAYVLSDIVATLLYLLPWFDSAAAHSFQEGIFAALFSSWLDPFNASLLFAVCFVAIIYIPVYLLDRKNIIIKV